MIKTPTAPFGFVPLKILCVIRMDGLCRNVTWKRYRNSSGGCWYAEGNYFAIPEKGRSRKMVEQKKIMWSLLKRICKLTFSFTSAMVLAQNSWWSPWAKGWSLLPDIWVDPIFQFCWQTGRPAIWRAPGGTQIHVKFNFYYSFGKRLLCCKQTPLFLLKLLFKSWNTSPVIFKEFQ